MIREVAKGAVLPDRQATIPQPHALLDHIRRIGRADPPKEDFQRIFEVYYDRVRYFFLRRGLAPERSRDLTQETFLRVFQGKGVFGSTGEFEAWLFQIALNVYRNAQRAEHAAKRSIYEESLDAWMKQHQEGIPERDEDAWKNPLDRFLEQEQRLLLAEALGKLPAQMRRCMVLRIHHELKYREIAERVDISVETVKAHLYQGRQRLQELLNRPREEETTVVEGQSS